MLKYDAQKLDKVLSDFYNATGVSVSILREDFSMLGYKKANNPYCRLIQGNKGGRISCFDFNKSILEECKKSKESHIYICPAGLVEITVPLIYKECIIGYAVLGHIRSSSEFEKFSSELEKMIIDVEAAKKCFDSLPIFNKEKLESITAIAAMLCRSLILDNVIKPQISDAHFERIKNYVEDNVEKNLTPTMLAQATYMSRTTLYLTIQTHTGCTVKEFVYKIKIERAKEMLIKTDLSIKDIAEALGFSSQSYFCKIFKMYVGVSPTKFSSTRKTQ